MTVATMAARDHQKRHGGTWAAAMSVCLKAAGSPPSSPATASCIEGAAVQHSAIRTPAPTSSRRPTESRPLPAPRGLVSPPAFSGVPAMRERHAWALGQARKLRLRFPGLLSGGVA